MGSASSGSPEQSIPTGHLGHPFNGCVPLVPLRGQETSGQMSSMSRLSRFLPPSARPAGRHRSSVNGSSRDLRWHPRMRRRSIKTARSNRLPTGICPSNCLPTTLPTTISNSLPTTFQGGVYQPSITPAVGSRLSGPGGPWAAPPPNATEKRNAQNCDDRNQPNCERKARDPQAARRRHPRVRALSTPGCKRGARREWLGVMGRLAALY
jgi:hypothetical protein